MSTKRWICFVFVRSCSCLQTNEFSLPTFQSPTPAKFYVFLIYYHNSDIIISIRSSCLRVQTWTSCNAGLELSPKDESGKCWCSCGRSEFFEEWAKNSSWEDIWLTVRPERASVKSTIVYGYVSQSSTKSFNFCFIFRLVLKTLEGVDQDRRCFRMIGGVLVERKVGEIVPALTSNTEKVDFLK